MITDKPKTQTIAESARRASGGYLIELRNVFKNYETSGGNGAALRGVSMRVGDGEYVAILGKSGSGKTTLLNMITGIDRPTSGEIYASGNPLQILDENSAAVWRGRNVGIVFQFFQLLPTLTVAENVMLPMDFCNTYPAGMRKKRALELLEQVDIARHADKFPAALSGGERQRVAIARALANDPALIVADEPTGNLDSRTAESIYGLFDGLAKTGKTLIVVSHDPNVAKRAGRTVTIADGEIACDSSKPKES